jgi:hypothetical protein
MRARFSKNCRRFERLTDVLDQGHRHGYSRVGHHRIGRGDRVAGERCQVPESGARVGKTTDEGAQSVNNRPVVDSYRPKPPRYLLLRLVASWREV